jgi:hypothetical protein
LICRFLTVAGRILRSKGSDAKTKRAIRLVLDLSDARLPTPIPQVTTTTIEEEEELRRKGSFDTG